MRVTKIEVMEHLKRLHAAHGVPEHHRGVGLELAAGEYVRVLGREDSLAVQRAVDELCGSDTRFFPKPGAVLVAARRHRVVDTGPGLPDPDGWPCTVCGEPFRAWVVQREDESDYIRFLVRHLETWPCRRLNGHRRFVSLAPTPPQDWDWRDILVSGKRGGEPTKIGEAA